MTSFQTPSKDFALGSRFMAYARRVRHLDLDEDLVYRDAAPLLRRQLDTSVFKYWISRSNGVFSHVNSLDIDNQFLARHGSYSVAFLATVAIPGSLSSFRISIEGTSNPDPPPGLMEVLRSTAPGLHALSVHACERPLSEAWDSHINALVNLPAALVSLSTSVPISFSQLLRAVQTSSLHTLSLGSITNTPSTPVALDLPASRLGRLRFLYLEDDTPSAWLARDLVTSCGPGLEHCTLKLCGRSAYDFADVLALANAISRLPGITNLDLIMHDYVPLEPSALETAAVWDALRQLSQLENLELQIPRMIVPSTYLTTMMDACPHLCSVELGDVLISMPFISFLALLHRRPELANLSVLLGITELPDTAACVAFGTHHYSLTLVFEDVADDTFIAFRDIVTRLLPNVERLTTQDLSTRYWMKLDDKWWDDSVGTE
jgi:hypothetical protein